MATNEEVCKKWIIPIHLKMHSAIFCSCASSSGQYLEPISLEPQESVIMIMSFSGSRPRNLILLAAVLSIVKGMWPVIFHVDNGGAGEGQLSIKSQPDIASVHMCLTYCRMWNWSDIHFFFLSIMRCLINGQDWSKEPSYGLKTTAEG